MLTKKNKKIMTAPLLEFDMLVEMKVYMNEMIKEHTKELNAMIKIRHQFSKISKVAEVKDTKKRIDKLIGYKNKAHNFVLFLRDYLEKIK